MSGPLGIGDRRLLHFVILAQSILFRGAGLDVVWPQFAALLLIGAVLFYFSLHRFRKFLR
jgi:ABC-2 type transport system permease protein